MNPQLEAKLGKIQKVGLALGVLGLIAGGIGFAQNPQQFYQSWLFAFWFPLGLCLGSLGFTMIHHLTGGFWGLAIRRQLEASIRTLPLMVLFFLPILVAAWTHPGEGQTAHNEGSHYHGHFWLYPWTDLDAVKDSHLLTHKQPYLNIEFWTGRAILYFVVFAALGFGLVAAQRKYEETGDRRYLRRTKIISGPGIVLYFLAMTFAAFDWAMSADPNWFSTMYGVIFIASQGLSVLAFGVLFSSWVRDCEPYKEFAKPNLFHDLGTLMFALTMFWAYVSFSQFLIIWSANLAEETPWYLVRTDHGWQGVALSLVVFGFFVPWFLLLMRRIKRDATLVPKVAILVLLMRFVDTYWQITPMYKHGLAPHWLDFALPVGLTGIWLWFYVGRLKAAPITTKQHDEAIHAELASQH